MKERTPQPRTLTQNRALRLFCRQLSDNLNILGLEMKVVLKPSYQIWWTPQAVLDALWRPLQQAKFNKKSTTELKKVGEIDAIHEDLMRILGEKFGKVGFEYLPFPSQTDGQNWESKARQIPITKQIT